MNLTNFELDNIALEFVFSALEATDLLAFELIQPLWSDYGGIVRLTLNSSIAPTAIVKRVTIPSTSNHPRGWNTDISHQRKLRSYVVEQTWYQDYAGQCGAASRVPRCYGSMELDGQTLIILEDLDASGFPKRATQLDEAGVRCCLDWLAQFHATFLNVQPDGLWPIGTYWHLDTRSDELAAMPAGRLRDAAGWLDKQLSQCPIQTLVHGDAKLANFCFSPDGQEVAAVDFQYVGGGVGVKDVAYFLGSCLAEDQLLADTNDFVDVYFSQLASALTLKGQSVIDAVEAAWRPLFPIAWADFNRFLHGWMPGHQKLNQFGVLMEQEALHAWETDGLG